MGDNNVRSMVKAISWRIMATSATIILVFIFTGELILAAGVGLLEVISKIMLYFIHERLWNLVKWGVET